MLNFLGMLYAIFGFKKVAKGGLIGLLCVLAYIPAIILIIVVVEGIFKAIFGEDLPDNIDALRLLITAALMTWYCIKVIIFVYHIGNNDNNNNNNKNNKQEQGKDRYLNAEGKFDWGEWKRRDE